MFRSPVPVQRAVPAALAVLAVALAWTALSAYRSRTAVEENLTARLARSVPAGVTGQVTAAEIAQESDPERARIRVARALVASGLQARPQNEETPRPADDPLEQATALAARALARRPAAWDAAMLLGAATYLERSRNLDARLFSRHRDWERPLETALALAPGQREPVRFLAAAYLEIWAFLAPAKQQHARKVLAEAFHEPDTFAALIGAWLAVAPDRTAAFSLVPSDPAAWERLAEALEQRKDWPALSEARGRARLAFSARLGEALAEADTRLAGGDLAGARELYLAVGSLADRSPHRLSFLTAALDRCPPGPVDRQTATRLAGQLQWALDRCQFAECPLDPRQLKRLARLCRVPPAEEALALLAAGDLAEADRLERRADDTWKEEWAPYLLLKARVLAGRGRTDEAVAALAQVHRSRQNGPLYWQVRVEVARAQSNPLAEQQAQEGLRQTTRTSWPATAWTFHRGQARLEMAISAAASGVSLRIDAAPESGALVELRLDGKHLGTAPVAVGSVLNGPAKIAPGLHLLEVQSIAGGAVYPGAVTLR